MKFYYGVKEVEINFDEIAKLVPEGWKTILKDGFTKMFESGWDGKVFQIKEKFGSLRLYLNEHNEDLNFIIDEMTKHTQSVCYRCGKPATTNTKGWFLYSCEEHKER